MGIYLGSVSDADQTFKVIPDPVSDPGLYQTFYLSHKTTFFIIQKCLTWDLLIFSDPMPKINSGSDTLYLGHQTLIL